MFMAIHIIIARFSILPVKNDHARNSGKNDSVPCMCIQIQR